MTGFRFDWRPGVLLSASLFGLGIAGLWVLNLPQTHQARAVISLANRELCGDRTLLQDEWLGTMALLATSRPILERAASLLALSGQWNSTRRGERRAPLAADALLEHVEVAHREDTMVIEILARDGSPAHAEAVADAVSLAFVEHRRAITRAQAADALRWLEAALQVHTERQRAAESNLQAFEREPGVAAWDERAVDQLVSDRQALTNARVSTRLDAIQQRAHLAKLTIASKEPDPFQIHLSELGTSPLARSLTRDYREAQLERSQLEVDDDARARLFTKVEALNRQMRTLVDSLVEAARADLLRTQEAETQLVEAARRAEAAARVAADVASERYRLRTVRDRATSELARHRALWSQLHRDAAVPRIKLQATRTARPLRKITLARLPGVGAVALLGAFAWILLACLMARGIRLYRTLDQSSQSQEADLREAGMPAQDTGAPEVDSCSGC